MTEHHPSTAEMLERLATEMHDAEGVEQTVDTVVEFCCRAVGCEFASMVLIDRRQCLSILALSDPKLAELYHEQVRFGEGPLITAVQQDKELLIPDVLVETRWSQTWTNAALVAGIRSAIHIPVRVRRDPGAVLSLFSGTPGGFDDDDLAVAHLLAGQAAVAIARARDDRNPAVATDVRRLIGQALGILMERYDLDDERALEVLRQYSKNSKRKLRDVAQELIESRRPAPLPENA
ncbi:GAF and ANTAR domain-containing protein [Kribbella sp. NPDC004875]|uniref:GAF and ANTAR domain-containing protein n=1 Tax=Kribbella sp. NPDC004875 TaxID=3364107 RepID=UPI0036B69B5F